MPRVSADESTEKHVPLVRKRRRFDARILLVEDNLVNRKVATGILKKCECDVTEAENGRVALEVLETKSFDCVFMDVQMPEMDGLEATRRIRADGRWKDLPIVAMTAHAMKGDHDRCLEAGMNDYVMKPVTVDKVKAMVEKWASSDASSQDSTVPRDASWGAASNVDQQPIDIENALDQLGGDRELFDDVVRAFVGTIPELLGELRSACNHTDGHQLQAAAHSLRGAAANICAEPTRQAALRLEQMGTQADLGNCEAALAELESHLERLQEFVKTIATD